MKGAYCQVCAMYIYIYLFIGLSGSTVQSTIVYRVIFSLCLECDMLFTRSRQKSLMQPVVVYCLFHEKNKTIDEATLDYKVSSPHKPPYKCKNSACYAWNVTCCLHARVHKSLPRSLLQPFIVYYLAPCLE